MNELFHKFLVENKNIVQSSISQYLNAIEKDFFNTSVLLFNKDGNASDLYFDARNRFEKEVLKIWFLLDLKKKDPQAYKMFKKFDMHGFLYAKDFGLGKDHYKLIMLPINHPVTGKRGYGLEYYKSLGDGTVL